MGKGKFFFIHLHY